MSNQKSIKYGRWLANLGAGFGLIFGATKINLLAVPMGLCICGVAIFEFLYMYRGLKNDGRFMDNSNILRPKWVSLSENKWTVVSLMSANLFVFASGLTVIYFSLRF